jgi:hypothetical protein
MKIEHVHLSQQFIVEDEISAQRSGRWIAQSMSGKARSKFRPLRVNPVDVRLCGDDEKAVTLGITTFEPDVVVEEVVGKDQIGR